MVSRRAWIGRLLTLAGLTGLTLRGHAAETPGKVSQVVAKYQDRPNNGQMCSTCKFYIRPGGQTGSGGMMGGHMGSGMMGSHMGPGMMAAGTCAIVEGSISPMGWCVLYQFLGARDAEGPGETPERYGARKRCVKRWDPFLLRPPRLWLNRRKIGSEPV
jgi:hypothetical protein